VPGRASLDGAAVDGDPPDADDVICGGVEPGHLEVDGKQPRGSEGCADVRRAAREHPLEALVPDP